MLARNDYENSKVFEQKGDFLNFKANIDPMLGELINYAPLDICQKYQISGIL